MIDTEIQIKIICNWEIQIKCYRIECRNRFCSASHGRGGIWAVFVWKVWFKHVECGRKYMKQRKQKLSESRVIFCWNKREDFKFMLIDLKYLKPPWIHCSVVSIFLKQQNSFKNLVGSQIYKSVKNGAVLFEEEMEFLSSLSEPSHIVVFQALSQHLLVSIMNRLKATGKLWK